MTTSWFLTGDESFLIEEHIAKLQQEHADKQLEQPPSEMPISELLMLCTAPSLFSATKLIILKNPWFLYRQPTAKELDTLTDLIKTTPETGSILVITAFKSVDMRKKVPALLKKKTTYHEYKAFKDWEQDKLHAWIQKHAEKTGKKIEKEAVMALEEVAGMDLRQVANELKKLSVYIGDRDTILAKDVHAASGGAKSSLFDFQDALRKRNMPVLMQSAYRLLAHGDDPLRLLGIMVAQIRFFYQVLYLNKQKKSIQEIGKTLGKNPYFVKRVLSEIQSRYTCEKITTLFQECSQFDVALKSGKINPKSGFLITLSRWAT